MNYFWRWYRSLPHDGSMLNDLLFDSLQCTVFPTSHLGPLGDSGMLMPHNEEAVERCELLFLFISAFQSYFSVYMHTKCWNCSFIKKSYKSLLIKYLSCSPRCRPTLLYSVGFTLELLDSWKQFQRLERVSRLRRRNRMSKPVDSARFMHRRNS